MPDDNRSPTANEPTDAPVRAKAIAGLRSLASLQIVTIVAEPDAAKGTLDKVEIHLNLAGREADLIATSINVVTGDITNIVPSRFWTPEGKDMLDFHLGQVKEASAIITANIRTIAEYGEKLVRSLKKLEPPTTP